ncbi:MAG: hypothetical protein ACTSWX_07655 [Promethearchaeota archaeon]
MGEKKKERPKNELEEQSFEQKIGEDEGKKKKKGKRRWFSKKRDWEENFDQQGNYVPREKARHEVYTDYYGPIIEDEKGHQAGKFFFEEYNSFGRHHIFGEFVLVLLFGIYFAFGGYNLYYIGGVVRDAYTKSGLSFNDYSQFLKFGLYAGLIILAIWIISLSISYYMVKIFARIAPILMFTLVFLEIGLLSLLYLYIDWEYNWIFIVLVIPNILMLTIWYKKFEKAIYVLRMSSLAVAKQREILVPQITQTLWIMILSFFHLITSFDTFFDITPITGATFEVSEKTIEITKGSIFFAYTCLFIFLIFVIYYVSQGMKMLMIHNWYRGGGSMGFWKAYRVIRYRWWGIIGYAFSSAIIHMLQSFRKMVKGEFGPQNIKDCFTQTGEIIPTQVNALRTKKGTPWYERIWMSLNFYSLPCIVIENKFYHQALVRSLYLSIRDIPSRYIKKSKVDLLFYFVKYALIIINGIAGALIGYAFAKLYGLSGNTLYVMTGLAIIVFMWVAGGTSTLIVNDLNNSYVTILFIHTIDELNKKEHYTLNELGKIEGETTIVEEKPKWYQFSKKRKSKKNEKNQENKDTIE